MGIIQNINTNGFPAYSCTLRSSHTHPARGLKRYHRPCIELRGSELLERSQSHSVLKKAPFLVHQLTLGTSHGSADRTSKNTFAQNIDNCSHNEPHKFASARSHRIVTLVYETLKAFLGEPPWPCQERPPTPLTLRATRDCVPTRRCTPRRPPNLAKWPRRRARVIPVRLTSDGSDPRVCCSR